MVSCYGTFIFLFFPYIQFFSTINCISIFPKIFSFHIVQCLCSPARAFVIHGVLIANRRCHNRSEMKQFYERIPQKVLEFRGQLVVEFGTNSSLPRS